MKKVIKIFLFFIILLFSILPKGVVYAHPLDQTKTKIYLVTDERRKSLPENSALFEIFVTWQQMSYIHEQGEDGIPSTEEPSFGEDAFDSHMKGIYSNPEKHRNYIYDNIEIKAQGLDCDITSLNEAPYDKKEVLLGEGVKVTGEIICPADPSKSLRVLNRMFMEDFPYQSHSVEVYLYGRIVMRESIDKDHPFVSYPQPTPPPSSEPSTPKEGFMDKLKSSLIDNIEKPSVSIFLILFMIGFLHSLEAGHSKTLVVLSVSERRSIKEIFGIVLTFVVTHVADILVLSIGLYVAFPWINSYALGSVLEKYALYGILGISGYQIISWINNDSKTRRNISKHNHLHLLEKKKSFSQTLWIAFLSGLAPCAMGWTVFVLIISSGKFLLAIPYTIVFALGIASAVLLLAFGSHFLSRKASKKWKKLGRFVPLVSYLLIFIFSLARIF